MGRSIKDSINDAAFTFVKQGFQEPTTNVVDIKPAVPPVVSKTPPAAKPEPQPDPQPKSESITQPPSRPEKKKAPIKPKLEELPDHRVPLSTRMRAGLVAEIKREGLRRQLAGTEPQTVQAILEEAAEQWLKRNSTPE